MSNLYSYNNVVTKSGSYQLFPTVWVLGIASAGGGGVTFEGSNVNATLSFAPALVGAINPYSVTSTQGANVTISSPGSTLIGLLTGSTFTADGGTITVSGDDAISALSGITYKIQNGGTVNINDVNNSAAINALSGSSVNFGQGGGTLVISPGSNISVLSFSSITGFENAGSTIEIPGATKVTSVVNNGSTTTITTDNGKSVVVDGTFNAADKNLFQSDQNGNLYISSTGSNNTSTPGGLVCFLDGTMIETPGGYVDIADIREGDTVVTYNDGVVGVDTVTFAGKSSHKVSLSQYADVAGYPVRVKKDAISDGVPFKDLLITPEHCLHIDGKFIPVRMLVNGGDIAYDMSKGAYDYYHIETSKHSVIKADGMETESYLDTGHSRSLGRQESKNLSWGEDSAAPLCVDVDSVKAIFEAIHGVDQFKPDVSYDKGVYILSDEGTVFRPARVDGDDYTFMIPATSKTVRICSNVVRPCDIIGSYFDDRRELGIMVSDVAIAYGGDHLEQIALTSGSDGWYDVNEDGSAWTNGNALITLPERDADSQFASRLTFTVKDGGPYLVREKISQVA